MTLLIIYIVILITTIALSFMKNDQVIKFKKWFTYGHLVSVLILAIDVFLITKFKTSFRTVWFDRVIALSFFCTGALTFALFSNTYKLNFKKLYFGFLFFYPLLAAFVFLLDRILFVIIALPLIITLICPEIYYNDQTYEIRGTDQLMAPKKISLIKKELFFETEVGTCTEVCIGKGTYKEFKILHQNNDSINISIIYDGKLENLAFRK